MFRRIGALSSLAALLGVVLAAGSAGADQGQNLYQWSGRGNNRGVDTTVPGAPGGASYAAPYYDQPAATSGTPVSAYQAYYPLQSGNDYAYGSLSGQPSDGSVLITVSAPADARIWFGSSPTKQRGTQRLFQSPPLVPGSEYTYDIKASWNEDGREVTRTRHVTVHAGDAINVAFAPNP